ncbi:hypothetical protein [Treponema endosymbiont of Eucomonympha sp.]|uniref:hypothetical protein n=1 Tax=Treponema endosymbiont of Eucomonympha sp. TaxID=1580831 RepID=UPI00164F293E|nr:hypothetical protein [Treponema endosymbiont of Eucomonympha sp.]
MKVNAETGKMRSVLEKRTENHRGNEAGEKHKKEEKNERKKTGRVPGGRGAVRAVQVWSSALRDEIGKQV